VDLPGTGTEMEEDNTRKGIPYEPGESSHLEGDDYAAIDGEVIAGFSLAGRDEGTQRLLGHADLNGAGKLIAQNLVHKSAHILRPHFEKRMVVPVRTPRVKTEVGSEERVEIGDFATIFDFQSGSRLEDVSESCGRLIRSLPNRSCQPCEIGSKFGCL
jgi:hypothetical protein